MRGKSVKILIVDDEKDLCEILRVKFLEAGFESATAYDGHEALRKVIEHEPACVILDIRMPKEDGLSFLRKLRAYRHDDPAIESRIRKTPVLILTAAGSNMKSLFQMEGIADYFDKPFDFKILSQRVASLIESIA